MKSKKKKKIETIKGKFKSSMQTCDYNVVQTKRKGWGKPTKQKGYCGVGVSFVQDVIKK